MNKKVFCFLIAIILLLATTAFADSGTWYCPQCGSQMEASYQFCPNDGTPRPGAGGSSVIIQNNGPYDMGVPSLNGRSYSKDQMNMAILWVQTQLKATGTYYQGYAWDVTGHLGDHTMQEIASFMQSRGYRGHSGCVDQNVVNELAAYLGNRIEPVYIGGYYSHMDSIMSGGHTGSMQKILSNLIDMVPHVTTGARWVQSCLSKLGYYTGSIDGMYGERTEKSVNAFQKAYGFQERNYVTLGVARAMLEACYNSGCYLDDLP